MAEEDSGMVTGPGNPMPEPGGLSRLEVWLFLAVTLIGLLGFMTTLSTGDVERVAGREPNVQEHAPPRLQELK